MTNVYLPSDIIRTGKESTSNRRSRHEDDPISPELLNSLTRRQLLVLERMSKGESNKQIAYNLNFAETTVKAHVSAILRKLGVEALSWPGCRITNLAWLSDYAVG